MARKRQSIAAGAGVPESKLIENARGVWEIRWTEYDQANGRSRSRAQSTFTSDRVEAEAARQMWIKAMVASVGAVGPGVAGGAGGGVLPTVRDVCEHYEVHKGLKRASSQYWSLRQIVTGMGAYLVGPATAGCGLDVRGVQEYLAARRKAGVTSSTVRREIGAFKAALAWAGKSGLVPRGVAADLLDLLVLPAEGAARTRYLSEVEEGLVWDAAVGLFENPALGFEQRRVGLFVCIALETGARAGAIRGLTWDRVDLPGAGVIDFRDPGVAVSKKRRVPVPVSDRLRPVLARAVMDNLTGRGPGGAFVLGHGGVVTKPFERFRDRVVKASGGVLTPFTIHDMRRTWGSLRAQWGVPLELVAEVLGDSLEVVQKHYAHFTPGHLRSAVNARGKLTAGAAPPQNNAA